MQQGENRRRRGVLALGLAASLFAVLGLGEARAQTEEEHKSHHPEEAAAAAQPGASPASGAVPAIPGAPGMAGMGPPAGAGPPPGAGPPANPGGMGAGMGGMMKGMGNPPPKEMYPSLMALPELTPEKRNEVEQQSAERMHSGAMLMEQALDTMNAGTQSGDYAAMHDATTRLREGLAQLESGIAARRALAEGRAPREVALAWFKREMSLASPVLGEGPHGLFGLSVFHLFTMALLVAFAFVMLAMYFFKMRRAAALFGRLDPDKGALPPGSSPRLGGSLPPPPQPGAQPPADKTPAPAPSEKPPVPASPDKSPKPPESAAPPPAADRTPAPAPGGKPLPTSSTDKSPQPPDAPAEKPPAPAPPPKAS